MREQRGHDRSSGATARSTWRGLVGMVVVLLIIVLFLPMWFSLASTEPTRSSGTPVGESSSADCPVGAPVEVLEFSGSCAPISETPGDPDVQVSENSGAAFSPRPALSDANYDTLRQVVPSSLGFARVRSRLVFQAADERNVLTTVSDCTVLRLAGPMKNSSGSQGVGWSVRLRDPEGRTCQGFVSGTVLREP